MELAHPSHITHQGGVLMNYAHPSFIIELECEDSVHKEVNTIRFSDYQTIASFIFGWCDLYSSYRILHSKTAKINKIKMNNESTSSLLLSPFKWRYLKNPWVYIPPD